MKTLYLLRHAKAVPTEPDMDDIERPLAERGRDDARRLAEFIRAQAMRPALVLCSTSERTRETWELIALAVGAACDVKLLRWLYLAPASRLMSELQRLPASVDRVMIIGHNPGLEELAQDLVTNSRSTAARALREEYPPGALAKIALAIDQWSDAGPRSGRLARFIRPTDLG